MKGLALILGGPKKAKPPSPFGGEEPAAEPEDKGSEEASEGESGGSEKKYATLAAESIAAGDTEAASDALVSMVKACLRNYGDK